MTTRTRTRACGGPVIGCQAAEDEHALGAWNARPFWLITSTPLAWPALVSAEMQIRRTQSRVVRAFCICLCFSFSHPRPEPSLPAQPVGARNEYCKRECAPRVLMRNRACRLVLHGDDFRTTSYDHVCRHSVVGALYTQAYHIDCSSELPRRASALRPSRCFVPREQQPMCHDGCAATQCVNELVRINRGSRGSEESDLALAGWHRHGLRLRMRGTITIENPAARRLRRRFFLDAEQARGSSTAAGRTAYLLKYRCCPGAAWSVRGVYSIFGGHCVPRLLASCMRTYPCSQLWCK